jgi:hypothetical protein
MELVGREFIVRTENVMTVTSMNASGVERWAIDSVIDENRVYCELIDTNMSMYSGSGHFREFNILDIEDKLVRCH